MTLNRKHFFMAMGGIGLLPIVSGCNTLGPWTDTDTQKLAGTLEQAGFVLALTLGKKKDSKKYLELAATSLETSVIDGKLDPTDILTAIIANVKNDAVIIGVTTALAIYRIWWNDNLPSTTTAVPIVSALAKGLKAGLAASETVELRTSAVSKQTVVSEFNSKSLDNAVKAFFRIYKL